MRVLKQEVGVRIENKWMIDVLVANGAEVKGPFLVAFPEHLMDAMVKTAVPFDWEGSSGIILCSWGKPPSITWLLALTRFVRIRWQVSNALQY